MAALFLLSSLFLASSPILSAAENPLHSSCGRARNFTAGSVFASNLNRLMASLSSSAPVAGFSNATLGEPPDKVYGQMLCRGDASAGDCRACLAGAAADAAAACPGNKAATIFYELCQARYSDESFFGASTGAQYYKWNLRNVSDAAAFNRALGALLDNLTVHAAAAARMFAAGSEHFSDFEKVYALVQCSRDLAPETCNACLRDEIGDIPRCCKAKVGARVKGGSCFLRYEIYPFFNATAAAGPAPPPPAPPPAVKRAPPPVGSPAAEVAEKKNRIPTVAAAIVVPLVVASAIVASIAVYIRRKRRRIRRKTLIAGGRPENVLKQGDSLHFNLEDLKLATLNFSNQNKLGEGGFGIVYKGVLEDGQVIAVKRLVRDSGQGLEELKNEVELVANLQHRNLVRLLGYCLQETEKILVYEYLSNKSLEKFLFDPSRSKELTWEKRVKIVEGIARGLVYLHEDSRLKIIHRDLKASNILLDEGMNPKIADFGLARLFGNEQSYGNTQKIAGTHGYMAPEYMRHGQMSIKSDVYSFGVLLLEILTGKKCTGFHGSNPPTDLISYIWRLWEEGNPLEVLDKCMAETCPEAEVLRWIHVGLLCIQHDPLERPTMSLVVLLLSSNSASIPAVSRFSSFSTTSKSYSSNLETPESLSH